MKTFIFTAWEHYYHVVWLKKCLKLMNIFNDFDNFIVWTWWNINLKFFSFDFSPATNSSGLLNFKTVLELVYEVLSDAVDYPIA